MNELLTTRREKGRVWSHIRKRWLDETPEEGVRQEYLCVLAAKLTVIFIISPGFELTLTVIPELPPHMLPELGSVVGERVFTTPSL